MRATLWLLRTSQSTRAPATVSDGWRNGSGPHSPSALHTVTDKLLLVPPSRVRRQRFGIFVFTPRPDDETLDALSTRAPSSFTGV